MFIVVAMLVGEMIFLFVFCNKLEYAPRDTVCILFCATHKSLTLGKQPLNRDFANIDRLFRNPDVEHCVCWLDATLSYIASAAGLSSFADSAWRPFGTDSWKVASIKRRKATRKGIA